MTNAKSLKNSAYDLSPAARKAINEDPNAQVGLFGYMDLSGHNQTVMTIDEIFGKAREDLSDNRWIMSPDNTRLTTTVEQLDEELEQWTEYILGGGEIISAPMLQGGEIIETELTVVEDDESESLIAVGREDFEITLNTVDGKGDLAEAAARMLQAIKTKFPQLFSEMNVVKED